jgi:glycerol kinase
LAVGFWPGPAALRENWRVDRQWEPAMPARLRETARAQWRKAVTRSLDWV